MNSWKSHFGEYARTTEPAAGAIERLRERQEQTGRLLREHAREPRPGAVARLFRARGRAAIRGLWLAPVAFAVAACLLWVWSRPPRELRERLDAVTRVEHSVTEDVQLVYTGSGEILGTEDAPHIFWEVGTLEVEVRPGSGVALVVQTTEGSVTVTGTAFSVLRGPLGTSVSVRRGEVRVRCVGAQAANLAAPESALCIPTRSAGMLGRARALRASGAPITEVMGAVEAGVSLSRPGDPAIGELVALRLEVLLSEGRFEEARRAAEAYLESGDTTRRDEVGRIADELKK